MSFGWGKFRHEYLLVRSIVKKRVSDDMVGYAMWFEPRGLSKGRTGWEVLQGIIDVAPLLRCEGAKGIVIQSFCLMVLSTAASRGVCWDVRSYSILRAVTSAYSKMSIGPRIGQSFSDVRRTLVPWQFNGA